MSCVRRPFQFVHDSRDRLWSLCLDEIDDTDPGGVLPMEFRRYGVLQ
jgi:hypothetical protein